jgi:hypothetical protein
MGDFCLSVFLVQWPDAFQVPIVNSAMPPRFAMHLAFDLFRERFHRFLNTAGKVQRSLPFGWLLLCKNWFVPSAKERLGETVGKPFAAFLVAAVRSSRIVFFCI